MIDGTAYSTMVGLGELYFAAFVLALGLGDVAAGLVATVPAMLGAALALSSTRGVRRLGSHKRWTVLTAGLQAAALVPLAIGAAAGSMPLWAVYACATLYFGAGMAAGASWSTWIGTLVPARLRARWFGLRQRSLQAGTLTGFVFAGLALWASRGGGEQGGDGAAQGGRVLWAFAGLFALAALCRAVSTALLLRQDEPEPMPAGHRRVGWREIAARLRTREGGEDARLIGYMLLTSMAASVAAPFINPYVLQHLGRGYAEYALLIGALMFAKAVSLGPLGVLAQRVGPGRLLWWAGLGVVPIGPMWMVSDHDAWLLAVQCYSGAVWGAWELSTFLLQLRHLRPEERTSLMSVYYLGNWMATAAGSLIGAGLLKSIGPDHTGYMWIFALSGLARLATVPLLRMIVRSANA